MSRRPHILLLNSHDSGRYLGCYGVAGVRTPHLDRLAAEGLLLEQFTAVSPICSPSRGSMMTGRWPQRHGLVGLTHHGFKLNPGERHAAALFRDGGYETTLFHFQHVAAADETEALGFDHFLARSRDAEEAIYPYMARPAREVGDAVATWLRERSSDQPFFAQVNFNESHTPFHFGGVVPERGREATIPAWIEPDAEARDHFAHLAGAIAALDDGVGRVLAGLEAAGLKEQTIVVFATDHGFESKRDKWTCYESGLGIAAMMRHPAPGSPRGARLATPLSNVDLLPTLLDLADLPLPGNLDGESFAPVFTTPGANLPERPVFGIYHNGGSRSVREGRWKLIRNFSAEPYGEAPPIALRRRQAGFPRPSAELYDLSRDPHELNNLASAEPAETARLSRLLADWMRRVGDPIDLG